MERDILLRKNLQVGDEVLSGNSSPINVGNTLELDKIPVGTTLHCIELKPKKGAQIARSAGTSVQYVAKDGGYASLRLKSGEFRKVLTSCRATIGEVSNAGALSKIFRKSWRKRWLGVRPTVRGVGYESSRSSSWRRRR